MPRKIEISHRTIVFAVLFLIFLWFLYFIRDILLMLFVALLIMTILNPMVSKLSKFRIPRGFSVFISYLLVLGLLGVSIAGILPPLVDQTKSFIAVLPSYFNSLGLNRFISDQVIQESFSQFANLPAEFVKIGFSVFGNILNVLLVLAFAFYLLVAREKLDDQLSFFFGEEKKVAINRLIDALEKRLGGWARGELALVVLIAVFNYIGLTLLGIPYAISLAIIAGILEIIPYFGPIIAGALAMIIGFSISPVTGIAVAAMAFLIQQIENYVFVPKIMEKSVGVNPIITILALTIGYRLFGFVGIIISVPMVITLQVLIQEYFLVEKRA